MGTEVIEHVPGEAVDGHLAAVSLQIILQIPVAQMTVFGVDIAYQSHLLQRTGTTGDGAEVMGQLPAAVENPRRREISVCLQIGGEYLCPGVDEGIGFPGRCFIGAGLVAQQHQCIAPESGG
jgi:hypothetical protein